MFRNLIGRALYNGGRTTKRAAEPEISDVIRRMPFLWMEVDVGDMTAGVQLRNYVEQNSIRLLSNYRRELIDPPSDEWLGNQCTDIKGANSKVVGSGLWNQRMLMRCPTMLDKLDE